MRITPSQNRIAGYAQDSSKGLKSGNKAVQQGQVQFKGSATGAAKSGVANLMDWIERKGFLAEFLIIDTISMIIPRVVVGLGRDKEKTGKTNYKAAAEELGREITSGPSMMAIPLAIFAGLQAAIPSAKVPEKTMQDLSGAMMNVADKAASPELFKNKSALSKEFAGEVFEKAFGDEAKFKFEDKAGFKTEFVEALTAESKDKKAKSQLAENFEKLIVKINNKNTKEITQNTKGVDFGGGTSAKDLFSDFKKYSDDVVEKFIKKDFAAQAIENGKESAKSFLKNIQKSRSLVRVGASLASFAAVGSFLLYLPKLTQVSKVSPAQASANLAAAEGGANENK